uniref:3-isopropylmalate dehydratase large subunit n=1 Tax=Fervidicoccus fontis TaxID=683846 RepID=A0A7J3ZKH3_9CREN
MGSLALKILARHANKARIEPGEIVVARVDRVMVNDVTGPLALKVLEETGAESLVGSSNVKVYIVLDHYSPAHNWDSANAHRMLRAFASRTDSVLFDVGAGVAHQILCEGIVRPGELVVGADSHTITYGGISVFATGIGSSEAAYAMVTGELWFKAPEPLYVKVDGSLRPGIAEKDLALHVLSKLGADGALYRSVEFYGRGLKSLGVPGRLAVANMMVEAGAKTALFPFDEATMEWLVRHGVEPRIQWHDLTVEPEGYEDLHVDLNQLEPMVSIPPSPANVKPVSDVEGVPVDQVFIGSCTNGRYEDFVAAARIIRGRRLKSRLVIVPASQTVLRCLVETGLLKVFVDAGAVIGPPGCGPCFGAHMGVIGDGEVLVSTANRNFPGRVGPLTAKVYLVSPYTAAAAAVTGYITDPRPLLNKEGRCSS